MSSTTDDHISEFEARRLKREAGRAASKRDEKPLRRPVPAEQARNLFGGLITNGSPSDTDPAPNPGVASEGATQTSGEQAEGALAGPRAGSPSAARRSGEGVDELVRRVKDGAQAAAADAAIATRPRRPTGTADLAPDAATRKRSPGQAVRRGDEAAPRTLSWKRGVTWGPMAAVVLVVGIVLVPSFGSTSGRHVASSHGASVSAASIGAASAAGFGDALRTTVAAVESRLLTAARHATSPVKHVKRATTHRGIRSRRHAPRTTHTTAATTSQPVTAATSAASSQTTQTYTPPAPAASGQGSSAGTSSSSSNSQPAGPTNAGPLGGIGSCVKGC